MAALPGIVVPDVIAEGTTSDVLVISWIDGERLSDSSASDVRQLCDTLLSAYLIQLLETGLLHADPHPGNLMRTTDGRIAILDHGGWGVGALQGCAGTARCHAHHGRHSPAPTPKPLLALLLHHVLMHPLAPTCPRASPACRPDPGGAPRLLAVAT